MLSAILGPIQSIVSIVTAQSTPRRLAAGIALGMICGLVPKGNLTAAMLFMLLCSLAVNQGAGLIAMGLFTAVGAFTDPIADVIGRMLLTSEHLKPTWTTLADTPVVPWTNFHNSLVLGNLALGLVLAYPVYAVSLRVLDYGLSWKQTLDKYYVGTVVGYAGKVASIRRRDDGAAA